MRKNLTKKEREVVKYFLLGESQTNAVFKVFKCKNKNVAGAMATRIFARERVKKLLEKRQPQIEEHLVKGVQLSIQQELALMKIDRKAIMKRFKDLLYSKDQRVVYQMIDLWSKWTGAYAPEKKMLLEKSEIYQTIRELPEEKKEPGPEEIKEKKEV